MQVEYELGSTGDRLIVGYASNVKNTPAIRQAVLDGKFDAVVVKSSLVPDPLILAVAANKASLYKTRDCMRTRSIQTEILYNLSFSTNISHSLKTFGAADDDRQILVCAINKDLKEAKGLVEGDWISLESLHKDCDLKALQKLYKLKDEEVKNNLVNSLITKIAAKDSL
eukprot:TRINITY_DN8543_c0_g1_i7.p1 TRINITY_DN8543_c0_g1~~TRINITY_DN8543_c0_g1_i7.p1  ORF type:complete len:169 (-),score=1.67 TRINITY_DN8543_c0_g1_i7:47-553(-)